MSLAKRLAATFDLGVAHQPLALAAIGWGGHNQVFRLQTSTGTWAVKRHGRPGIIPPDGGFAIELTASAAGVPMARPMATAEGRCWADLDGHWYRCHEWIDGTAKNNEDTTVGEAGQMGRIVAHLHGLAIPCPGPPSPPDPRDRLMALVDAGRQRGAAWAAPLSTCADLATRPRPVELGAGELVGSHRDFNAHNVLFSETGLRLVDWDGAGPAWPRWERADFALRWADRASGVHDEAAVRAFLRGYRDAGGELDAADPDVLDGAPASLLPWVLENVEMAVAQPSAEQDELAAVMIAAVLDLPRRIATSQAVLARALATLLRASR